jgi:hypothetical protein
LIQVARLALHSAISAIVYLHQENTVENQEFTN